MLLTFVRHGQVVGAKGKIATADAPLSEQGVAAVRQLGSSWVGAEPTRFICSDHVRARQSAVILAERWRRDVECDARLREMSFGAWEGLTWDEVTRSHRDDWRAWSANWTTARVPGGECYGDVRDRFDGWIRTLAADGDERILVVSHAGVIRVALSALIGVPIEAAFRIRVDHASVTAVGRGAPHGGWELLHVNASSFPAG